MHQNFIFLVLLLTQVDYKSYLLDFKSLPLKDEADEDGNGSGGVTEDSGTTLTNFFSSSHSFPLHLCEEELIHFSFLLFRCWN